MSIRKNIKKWTPILNYPNQYRGYEPPSNFDVLEYRKVETSTYFRDKIKNIREKHNIKLTDIEHCLDKLDHVESAKDLVNLVGNEIDKKIVSILNEQGMPHAWYRTIWLYILADKTILFSTDQIGIKWAKVGKGFGKLVDDFMEDGVLMYIPKISGQKELFQEIQANYDGIRATLKTHLSINSETVIKAERIAELFFNEGFELEDIAGQLSEEEAEKGSTDTFDYHRVRSLFKAYLEALGVNFTLRK